MARSCWSATAQVACTVALFSNVAHADPVFLRSELSLGTNRPAITAADTTGDGAAELFVSRSVASDLRIFQVNGLSLLDVGGTSTQAGGIRSLAIVQEGSAFTIAAANGGPTQLFSVVQTNVGQNTAFYADPVGFSDEIEAENFVPGRTALLGTDLFNLASRIGSGGGGYPGIDNIWNVSPNMLARVAIGQFDPATGPAGYLDVAAIRLNGSGEAFEILVLRTTGFIPGQAGCNVGPGCQDPPRGLEFTQAPSIFSGSQIVAITAGDFDGDGDDDIAALLVGSVRIYVNDGSANFSAGPLIPTGFGQSIYATDLDSDGRDDLVVLINAPPRFTALGDLPGGAFSSEAQGISADGTTVVGFSKSGGEDQAFRWTSAGGMQALGFLPGGFARSRAFGVSDSGGAISGIGWTEANRQIGFFWTPGGGMVSMGALANASAGCTSCPESFSVGVSGDGAMAVGSSRSPTNGGGFEGFRWRPGAGMTGIGSAGGAGPFSFARAIGTAGGLTTSSIAGFTSSAQGARAFRWTQSGGYTLLPVLQGGGFASAASMSGDGSLIVGVSGFNDGSQAGQHAFLWSGAASLIDLGALPGGVNSEAFDIARDGGAVVGESESSDGVQAFYWTTTLGMRSLRQLLIERGATGLELWTLTSARSVSADGQRVVGFGTNPQGDREAWLADLNPATPGPGAAAIIVDVLDQTRSRASIATGVSPYDAVGEDFDGDGLTDLVVASYNAGAPAGAVTLMINRSAPPCPGDTSGDGLVNSVDLAFMLGAWGNAPGSPADLSGDGLVNSVDLALLLGSWGPCPFQ